MLFDSRTSRGPLAVYTGHRHDVTGVHFSPSAAYVLSVSKDGTARVWDCAHSAELNTNTSCTSSAGCSVAESLDSFTCMTPAPVPSGCLAAAYAGSFDGSVCQLRLSIDGALSVQQLPQWPPYMRRDGTGEYQVIC